MRIFHNFEGVGVIRNPVVTTGSFDGVHLGHKTILNRLKLLSDKHDGESVLITFYPHPRKVLYPEAAGKDLKLINSQEEKEELLRKAGLDNLIIMEFTRDFSKTTSEEFIENYLYKILKAKIVVVGFNHHFGFNKAGDYHQLWELGEKYNFKAEEIPELEIQNETVSSTLIRKAICEGYIQRANAYLDHYYIIIGIPELFESDHLPESVPFYKVPITEDTKLLPSPGIYAVSTGIGKSSARGMVFIYNNENGDTQVLLNPFDREKIFTGKKTTIYFHKKVSGHSENQSLTSLASSLKTAVRDISDLIY
jgi:riboflavin kinase/FMN adenylyltransferase